jgi:hypothetical protein
MDEDFEDTGEQAESSAKSKVAHLQPWQYKKGQSGNPAGRAKGISLKEYAKMKFLTMTDDEKEEYFNGLDKKIIWSMGEGNPDNKTDLTTKGEKIEMSPKALELAKEYEEKLKTNL